MQGSENFMNASMNALQQPLLLLEGNVAEAQALATFLESQGWLVTVAHTVEEALAQDTRFAAMLCDIYLGDGGSGIVAARALQQRGHLPIVFMSARSDSQTLDEALSVSPYGYLVKPFGLEEMLTTLSVAIARHEREQRDRERAAQLQDERLALICRIRHDLGSPMAAVGLTVNRLRYQGRVLSGAQFEAALTRIERSVQNIHHILDDFLERLYHESVRQSVQRPLRIEPMTLQFLQESLCGDVVDELWDSTVAKTTPIVACYEFTTTALALDAHLVRIVLHNLLSNAIKYSHSRQTVRLHVQVTPQTVQFQVSDRGIGIPPEFRNELFELFRRADNALNVAGSGVGLYAVKEAVEVHRGTIAVESVPHQGTTFTVTLPNGGQNRNPVSQDDRPSLGELTDISLKFAMFALTPGPSPKAGEER
ncbi:MAG TPA: hypothetical protein DCQ32_11690 [Cyanobacteria bacterium UBA8156]|nr:hypothetical protein [Cyanobacteria bacterium UBA8156]